MRCVRDGVRKEKVDVDLRERVGAVYGWRDGGGFVFCWYMG